MCITLVEYTLVNRLYLTLGLRLVKIRKVLKFRQSAFIRDFISQCTKRRAANPGPVWKSICKFISCINFGKSIENVRNRWNVQIINSPKKHQKLVNMPNYHSTDIFSEDFAIVKSKARIAKMYKAYAVGFVSNNLRYV